MGRIKTSGSKDAFTILKEELERIFPHPDPEHAVYALWQIEQAFAKARVVVSHQVDHQTPMGKLQRYMLRTLVTAPWVPEIAFPKKSMRTRYIQAADGLVRRGFAVTETTDGQIVYKVTEYGKNAFQTRDSSLVANLHDDIRDLREIARL